MTATALQRVEHLLVQGHRRAAIAALTAENRAHPDPQIDAALVQLRHDAWPELSQIAPGEICAPAPDATLPPDTTFPEITAADLDAPTIALALRERGALIVRGLLSHETCARLRDGIDRSWEAIERFRKTKKTDPAWFHPIDTSAYGLTMASRHWALVGGTSFVPDSPRLMFELLEAYEAANVRRVVTEYFGEPPAMSLMKVSQRRLAPDAAGGWHQDAAAYGVGACTLNFWTPISRCGDIAPGLAMWPRPLDYIVKTVGDEGTAEFTTSVDAVNELLAQTPAVEPVFDEGDCVVFDEWLLHCTSKSPDFTAQRYGFECWFFAPSKFPDPQRFIPLVW